MTHHIDAGACTVPSDQALFSAGTRNLIYIIRDPDTDSICREWKYNTPNKSVYPVKPFDISSTIGFER